MIGLGGPGLGLFVLVFVWAEVGLEALGLVVWEVLLACLLVSEL